MFACFVPEVAVGHRTFVSTVAPTEVPVVQEEGTPDEGDVVCVGVPEQPPTDPQEEEVETLTTHMEDVENDSECEDYGYRRHSDDEEQEGEGEEDDIDDGQLGPEDGEDPYDHDAEVHDNEGYGFL
jgi:hypothetical protein